jgi:hypothetical protein
MLGVWKLRRTNNTCHSWLRFAPHTCDSWGIDFSLVRYFTIPGFSDGRIVAILGFSDGRIVTVFAESVSDFVENVLVYARRFKFTKKP